MRHPIETAPKSGKPIILEDDATGATDIVRWSAKANQWLTKTGEPSQMVPTHWRPMPGEEDAFQSSIRTSKFSSHARWLVAASVIVLIGAVMLRHQFGFGPTIPQARDDKTATVSSERPQVERDQANARSVTEAAKTTQSESPDARLQEAAAADARSLEKEKQQTISLAQQAATPQPATIAGGPDASRALEMERDSNATLKTELATMRRENETQAQQLRASGEETAKSNQAAAESAQSLAQEREKAAALQQDLTAVRQELAELKAKSGEALDDERARTTRLKSELAVAQRESEVQTGLLRKTSDDARQFKQAASDAAETLEQERQKAAAEAREAASTRQELLASTVKYRQALDEQYARQAVQWGDLAAAQRETEAQAAQLRKARDEIGQLRKSAPVDRSQDLHRERGKSAALAEDVAAARQELTANAAKHRQALDEERTRSAALMAELAAARHENETQTAQLRKNDEEKAQLTQATERTVADLRQSLQQERERAEALAREAEAARHASVTASVSPPAESREVAKPAPAVEAVATVQTAAADAVGSQDATRLIARARALLGQGDIGAARTVLERAVESGSARASFALAETYDPAILSTWRTYGTRADATKARELYAKAQAGGIRDAKDRLERLNH